MKPLHILKTVFATILFLVGTSMFAQDIKFSMQGILKNFDGTVVLDGNYNMTFRIYTQASGGTAIWTEAQTAIPVTGGVYNTRLGETASGQTALAALPFDANYWVGITVESGVNPLEMTPRMQMTGSAYNYRSKHATTADHATTAGTANVALALSNSGSQSFSNDVWNVSNDGAHRFLYGTNSHSYYKTAGDHVFRNGPDQDVFGIVSNGALKIANNVWHISYDGINRLQYGLNTHTFYGTGDRHVFNNNLGGPAFEIFADGKLKFHGNSTILDNSEVHRFVANPSAPTYYNSPNGHGHVFQHNGATILQIQSSGGLILNNNAWIYDGTGTQRIHFLDNNHTYFNSPDGHVFRTGGTDRAIINNAGSFQTLSDRRFKTNIKPLENALDNVLKLEGVTYNWKKSMFKESGITDEKQIGLIAQELEKVYPEFVFTKEEDGFKSVNYAQLNAVLIEAIKDLNAKVESQNNEIQNLKADNSDLQQKQDSIEERLKQIEQYMQLNSQK